MVNVNKLLTITFFVLIVLSVSSSGVNALSTSANTNVTNAENELSLTYDIVSSVQNMGEDVSHLFAQLDTCADYLSEAYGYFWSGDYANANHYADLCYDLTMDVKLEAVAIRDEIQDEYYSENTTMMIRSAVDVFVVIVSSFGIWRILKYRKNVQLQKMKPEVVSDES